MSANATILLTPEEMARADRLAAQSGLSSFGLMDKAGRAVAASAMKHWPTALRFVVLCGPGNNGGDGYVAAGALSDAGAAVAVFAWGDPKRLTGDARTAWKACALRPEPLHTYRPREGDIVIDGLFGAGLSRDVPDEVGQTIADVETAGIPVLSIDLPTGVCGLRGSILGRAFQATRTVTFMTRKPGHLLLPGRNLCGTTEVFDIGIPMRIVQSSQGAAGHGAIGVNEPAHWLKSLPVLDGSAHKYRRGHLAVFSGAASHTGAARLSAHAALRTGAGLVTLAAPSDAMPVVAPSLNAVMLREVDDEDALRGWLAAAKLHAGVIGPGFGVGHKARNFTRIMASLPMVVDADAITAFAACPETLFDAFAVDVPHLVLTPHEGEFQRLFPDIAADPLAGKVEKAQAAARRAHGVVVYKGADTVIAAPDGRALINENAPPWLATAGSGDVLAGMIGALMAQGMPAFEAAAAGVWLHGAAGQRGQRGLTAETLIEQIADAVDSVA